MILDTLLSPSTVELPPLANGMLHLLPFPLQLILMFFIFEWQMSDRLRITDIKTQHDKILKKHIHFITCVTCGRHLFHSHFISAPPIQITYFFKIG